jgi:CBS domain-containing protein
MLVRDVMTANPATVEAGASLESIVALLHELDVRHLPVIDEAGQLSGIISDRDIAPYRDRRLQGQIEARQIMSAAVFTTGPDNQLSDVVDTMLDQKVGAMPVLNASNALVGIVSYIDILRAVRDDV